MKQGGFTLVELAISLTIIALLLLVVLKGQTLIDQAKAKDVVAMAEDLRIATTSFRQRFNYLPGDWPYTANEIPGVTAATTVGTNGNGIIEGDVDVADGTAEAGSEVAALPLQLFGAGFIGKINQGDTQRRLSTSFGPAHVVSKATAEGLVAGFSANNPAARSAIVFNKLPCDVAREVDTKIDDGSITTGHATSTACLNGVVQWYAVAL